MPPKNKKKTKRREAEAATAQTDEELDNMLAEVMAADLAICTGGSATSSSSSSSTSSSSTSRPEVSEASIFEAVDAGDLTRMLQWGRLGVRCDYARPLCLAARLGNVAVVKCMINELGADANRVLEDGDGLTPVHFAALNGQLNVVICLVKEFGADANQPNKHGGMPMCVAAMRGHMDVVRVLVRDFGADLNHADKYGSTALMAASLYNYTELVKWLVKEGADTQSSLFADGRAADLSRHGGASAEQTAYLEAKTHCSNTGCSGAGIMKCTGCKQARYCKEECQLAHWQAHKADCKRWRTEAKSGKGKK
jgi:hypothetical protein